MILNLWGVSNKKGIFILYSLENVDEDGGIIFFVGRAMPNIKQGKVHVQSRHVSSKSYYQWEQFDSEAELDPIKFWYCQCKSGPHLVGSCAHIASLLWYVGIQRHKDMSLNTQIMLENVLDWNKSSGESSSSDVTDFSSESLSD